MGDLDVIERAVTAYVARYDALGHRENSVYAGVPEMLRSVGLNRTLVLVTAKRQAIAESITSCSNSAPTSKASTESSDQDGLPTSVSWSVTSLKA